MSGTEIYAGTKTATESIGQPLKGLTDVRSVVPPWGIHCDPASQVSLFLSPLEENREYPIAHPRLRASRVATRIDFDLGEDEVSTLAAPSPTEGEWAGLCEKLASLGSLQDGWDSFLAPRPASGAIDNARALLDAARIVGVKPNRVAPSVVGGVGITFRRSRRSAYVEFLNTGKTYVLFSDSVGEPQIREVGHRRENLRLVGEIRAYLNA